MSLLLKFKHMTLSAFPGSASSDNSEDEKKKADKRRFENDLISMESDRSKFAQKVEAIELDLRTLQKNYNNLGFEIKDKQAEVKKHQGDLEFLDEEIRILKKKVNNL